MEKINGLSTSKLLSQAAIDEKKKVHFVRSHTPKPVKSKAIHSEDTDFMNNPASRYLSPLRGISINSPESQN